MKKSFVADGPTVLRPRKIGVNFYFILKESYEKIIVFEVNTSLKDPSTHK